MQLARQVRSAEFRQPRLEVGAAQPVNVELGALQRPQQPLFGGTASRESFSYEGLSAYCPKIGTTQLCGFTVVEVQRSTEPSRAMDRTVVRSRRHGQLD